MTQKLIKTVGFEETWIDFLKGWPKVKFPKGLEPMIAIVQRAKLSPLPQCAKQYDDDGIRLLVAVCRELQRVSGDQPFFLACRTAGRELEVDHMTASRWLFLLVQDKTIKIVQQADRAKRQAIRYRYLGD